MEPISLENLARVRYADAISQYAQGSDELEQHAVSQCLPAIAALELDEAYASIVLTARMDMKLRDIIEHGAGRQGNAEKLLFDIDCPLSSFSAKIRMAFFLGFLTEKMRSAIDLCRGIRNTYAHSDSPEAGRTDPKYIKKKRALLALDPSFNQIATDALRKDAGDIELDDDHIVVTALMVRICDQLEMISSMNRMHGQQMKPQVLSAFFGFDAAAALPE